METQEIIKKLQSPFPLSAIKWRVGRRQGNQGQALPYIDARDVQDRLDQVVGPEKWEVTMKPSSVGIISGIKILLDGNWVLKEDGAQFDNFRNNDDGNAKELAIKGAFSDAFKRAAVMWGVARYLYAFKAPFVDLNENGQFVTAPTLPADMLPEDERGAAAQETQATTQPATQAVAASTTTVAAANDASAVSQAAPATPAAEAEAQAEAKPAATQVADKPVEKTEQVAAADEAQKSVAAAAAVEDERRSRLDAMADSAAAAEPEQTEQGAAGTKVAHGYDYSHLTLAANEEEIVQELLGKVDKLSPPMLRNYVAGDKLKDKLNESARTWIVSLIDARKARMDAAAKAA